MYKIFVVSAYFALTLRTHKCPLVISFIREIPTCVVITVRISEHMLGNSYILRTVSGVGLIKIKKKKDTRPAI